MERVQWPSCMPRAGTVQVQCETGITYRKLARGERPETQTASLRLLFRYSHFEQTKWGEKYYSTNCTNLGKMRVCFIVNWRELYAKQKRISLEWLDWLCCRTGCVNATLFTNNESMLMLIPVSEIPVITQLVHSTDLCKLCPINLMFTFVFLYTWYLEARRCVSTQVKITCTDWCNISFFSKLLRLMY